MIKAIAFDFDGVLVESVDVKTRAFARLFASESSKAVQRITEYHLRNGGVSRFEKFRTIYRDILKRPLTEREFQSLCKQFAKLVVEGVVTAPWVKGAREFLVDHRGRYAFFVISGTPEEEMKGIVHRRGMDKFFDDVLGSPRTKDVLLEDALRRHGLQAGDMVFVGDAETDWVAARSRRVQFIWRRTPNDTLRLPGFRGPSVPSLACLEACLSDLERQGV